jgi:hypothetical protein
MALKDAAAWTGDYILHSILALPVAFALGFLPEALIGNAHQNTVIARFAPVICLCAVVLALLSSKWIRSDAAKWVWIGPWLWFSLNFHSVGQRLEPSMGLTPH